MGEAMSSHLSMPPPSMITRLDGPSVEQEIAHDMIKRSWKGLLALIAICTLAWNAPGLASSSYAVALIVVNFALAAALLSWTARISLGLMMGTALFGYLLRLALIFTAVFLVKDAGWVNLWPLGLSIIVTHLGLLLWEIRYVSASLAFPGLKPSATK